MGRGSGEESNSAFCCTKKPSSHWYYLSEGSFRVRGSGDPGNKSEGSGKRWCEDRWGDWNLTPTRTSAFVRFLCATPGLEVGSGNSIFRLGRGSQGRAVSFFCEVWSKPRDRLRSWGPTDFSQLRHCTPELEWSAGASQTSPNVCPCHPAGPSHLRDALSEGGSPSRFRHRPPS